MPRLACLTLFAVVACASDPTGSGTPTPEPPFTPQPPAPPGTPRPVVAPIVAAPAEVVIDEDQYSATSLSVSQCHGTPTFTVGRPSDPNYMVRADPHWLARRFQPNTHGSATVDLTITCPNGSVTVPAAITVLPLPDVTYTFEQDIPDLPLPSGGFRFRVNGELRIIPPTSGVVQLHRGENRLEMVSNDGWEDLLIWEIDGKVIRLDAANPVATIQLGGDDLAGTIRARPSDP